MSGKCMQGSSSRQRAWTYAPAQMLSMNDMDEARMNARRAKKQLLASIGAEGLRSDHAALYAAFRGSAAG